MNPLIQTATLTMTSREIHSNVMRDIRNMMDTLAMDSELNPCAKSTSYVGRKERYPASSN